MKSIDTRLEALEVTYMPAAPPLAMIFYSGWQEEYGGWSWPELMDTPGWVVDDVRTYLVKKGIIDRERSRMNHSRGKR